MYTEVKFVFEWMGHQPPTKTFLLDNTAKELEKRGVVEILDSSKDKSLDMPVVDKMVKKVPKKKGIKK